MIVVLFVDAICGLVKSSKVTMIVQIIVPNAKEDLRNYVRWKEKVSDVSLEDGWHKYNPNKAKCDNCGSTNLEFNWCRGEPKAVACLDCGWEEHDPK